MQILFISPRQCWPARSGAKLREYYFLQALAKRAELTYLHFSDRGTAPLTRNDLPFCREVVPVPKPDSYGAWKLVRGVLGRWPLPILNYTSAEMTAAVDRAASAIPYDLIHLDSIHMIRYGQSPALRSGRIVYNWHNIESEAMRRFTASVASSARRWYGNQTARKLEALEWEILRTGFGHVVCSARERDELRGFAPAARIAVVENGVDTNSFAGAGASSGVGSDIVFVGAMDYYPNIDAATSFATRVWPRVTGRFPEARLLIVGANPTDAVKALTKLDGVTVTGTVPEVAPFYAKALAAIVPLRTGGGTRLKILEAMAAGVPVISTPLGAEGLAVTPGIDILLADGGNTEAWIEHLRNLTESPSHRDRIRNKALELVRARYDWQTLGAQLSETYHAWSSDARPSR